MKILDHCFFEPIREPISYFEVQPCVEIDGDISRPQDEEKAHFWAVYSRHPFDGMQIAHWIADFGTKEEAEQFKNFLISLIVNSKQT